MTVLMINFDNFKKLSENNRIYYYEGPDYFDFHITKDSVVAKSRVPKSDIDDKNRFFSDKMFYGAMELGVNIPVPTSNLIDTSDDMTVPFEDIYQEDEDKMTLTINDDLSGLLYLRVGAGAKVETREL